MTLIMYVTKENGCVQYSKGISESIANIVKNDHIKICFKPCVKIKSVYYILYVTY